MSYPLHLGVTEAGEGEEGRIKSAVGIGALLEDGIGDTVRVSLTEEPEFVSAAEHFLAADTDGSRELSIEELAVATGTSIEEAAVLHEQADTDGDGNVSLSEFISSPAAEKTQSLPRPVAPVRRPLSQPAPQPEQPQQAEQPQQPAQQPQQQAWNQHPQQQQGWNQQPQQQGWNQQPQPVSYTHLTLPTKA